MMTHCPLSPSPRSPLPAPPSPLLLRTVDRLCLVDLDQKLERASRHLVATGGCESSGTARKGRETQGKAVKKRGPLPHRGVRGHEDRRRPAGRHRRGDVGDEGGLVRVAGL
eukprot:SAG22_NODE_98_length_20720_cov_17.226662_11_plen_111_part_00